MIKVHSLSGGKTSSYMAYHYPADYNVFSLVTIEDKNCKPKDNGLIKKVSNKINKDFVATVEDDLTLYAMLDLEQKLGKEIIWLTGNTFEKIINQKKMLPNIMMRFCTTELKMRPIFDWWYKEINQKVKMGIGFRYDEKERADKLKNEFKGIVGKVNNRNKWQTIEWREGWFPLIEDKIFHLDVKKWSDKINIKFPNDSNCVGCFWKDLQQLRKNWDDNNKKMEWFANQETKKRKWKKEINYETIKKIGLQQDFFFGTGSGCQAGFCTD